METSMTQTICITGASSGFGQAVARKFAKAGWNCIITGRRKDRLEQLAAELAPAKVLVLSFDISDKDQVEKALANLPAPFSDIDILVNNAGLSLGIEPAQKSSLQDWETMIDTNIKGLVYCTHALLPGMAARQKGHVINIGSVTAHYAYPGSNVYGGTKAFVAQFSRGLRSDLHGTGVRVTTIEPGLAESEFSLVRFKGDQTRSDNLYAGAHPLTPEDVADAVFWSASTPPHVNINTIELMPVSQSWSNLQVARD